MDKVYVVWFMSIPDEPIMEKICRTREAADEYVIKQVMENDYFMDDFSIVEEELYG